MITKKIYIVGVLLTSVLFLHGCAGHSQIESVWEGKDYQREIEKISSQIAPKLPAGASLEEIASSAHLLKGQPGLALHGQLCFGYEEVRDYQKFNLCVESFFKRDAQQGIETYRCTTYQDERPGIMMFNQDLLAMKAKLLAEQGKVEEALALIDHEVFSWSQQYRQCLRDISGPGQEFGLATNSLSYLSEAGLLHAKYGDKKKARKILSELQQVLRIVSNKSLQQFFHAAMADIYMALEEYEQVVYELKSLVIGQSLAALSRSTYSTMLAINAKFSFARANYKLGRTTKAKPYYEELVAFPSTKQYGGIYYVALHDLAMINFSQNKNLLAVQMLEEAITYVEEQRKTIHTDSSKVGYVEDKQQLYADLIEILIQEGHYGKAFEYVERAKARALVDMLANKNEIGHGEQLLASQAIIEKISENELLIAGAYAQSGTENNVHVRSVMDAEKHKLRQGTPEIASLVTVPPLKTSDVQGRLASDETLLEFYGGQQSLTAFVVTKNSIRAISLSGDNYIIISNNVAAITQDVEKFRQELLHFDSGLYKKYAQSLYQQVFAPVADSIKSKKLIIVAHGPLHYLPFNALHDGESFLIDTYTIRMLPSASVMEFLGKNSGNDDSMLVLANPDLGDSRYDLPAAEQEGSAIAQGKESVTVLSRQAATETALRKYGSTTSRIHIASHGQFKAEDPLASRLLLAKDSENDGSLTVDELYNLELNSDLVVLSACETGLGDVKNGDDVIGLTRGFLFAGADSIVSSLWVVDDSATANLMVAFYDGLESQSKQEALRQAQLKIKNEYNEHPFFWAAFQLTGSM